MIMRKFLEFAAGILRRVKNLIWTTAIRGRFRRFGKGSVVEPFCALNHPSEVEVGERVHIREHAWINCLPREDGKPTLVIEDGSYIGRFANITAFHDVRIESDVMIADRVYIADADHAYKDPGIPIILQGNQIKGPVLLKRGCWIGTGAVILPGVTVGRNAVVGPNTVLHKDVPDHGMAYGSPAKVRERAADEIAQGGIYSDGTYIRKNPSLHAEDTGYKAECIRGLLDSVPLARDGRIKILDIGGGAGLLAAEVCRLLARDGTRVECHSYDLSLDMLALQRGNNPFLTLATSDLGEIAGAGGYDLAMLIDVIEHVPDREALADKVDRLARYIVYNIPTERNLADWLRDGYMRGRYYPAQTESLGHLHFFSAAQARRFVAKHHRLLRSVFPAYSAHVLNSDHPDYARQRESRLRNAELRISRWIYDYLRPLAPQLIQGSLFMLAESRAGALGGDGLPSLP